MIGGGQVVIGGTNDTGPGGTYHVLASTNVILPVGSWSVITNGTFDSSGNFSITNSVGASAQEFYMLQIP